MGLAEAPITNVSGCNRFDAGVFMDMLKKKSKNVKKMLLPFVHKLKQPLSYRV